MELGLDGRSASAFGVDSVDLLLDMFGFGRSLPDVVPVLSAGRCGTGTDDVEHIFRTVDERR